MVAGGTITHTGSSGSCYCCTGCRLPLLAHPSAARSCNYTKQSFPHVLPAMRAKELVRYVTNTASEAFFSWFGLESLKSQAILLQILCAFLRK